MAEANVTPNTNALTAAAELLGTNVDDFVSTVVIILLGLSAVGLLTFIIIDVIKRVLEPRIPFNRTFLLDQVRQTLTDKGYRDVEKDLKIVEDRILRVTTAGESDLLYEMPVDEFIGQLKTVTNLALSWPEDAENELVLAAFSRGLARKDRDNQQSDQMKRESEKKHEEEKFEEFLEIKSLQKALSRLEIGVDPASAVKGLQSNAMPSIAGAGNIYSAKKEANEKLADKNPEEKEAYFTGIVNSNLSALQIRMNYWWRMALQVLSILISGVLIFIFADLNPAKALFFSVIGGFIAPFAHDLVGPLRKITSRV